MSLYLIRLAWAKADVKCEVCGERSHPTNDCPKRGCIHKII